MWYITTYRLVSPISLKLSTATSTGGKSLLLPTPFALKMALLEPTLQEVGIVQAQRAWGAICKASVAVAGPDQITVNNTFTKIMKPVRGQPEVDLDTGLIPPMNHSIGFREYVWWQGDCHIAIELEDDAALFSPEAWSRRLTRIGYFGKRGGFVQAVAPPLVRERLEAGFTNLCITPDTFAITGTLQVMDDCAPNLPFEQVDIYSAKTLKVGKDRILRHIVLPYQVKRSSRSYTLYERLGNERSD
jgi:hypothetical protein